MRTKLCVFAGELMNSPMCFYVHCSNVAFSADGFCSTGTQVSVKLTSECMPTARSS